jgi:hypothetical protein
MQTPRRLIAPYEPVEIVATYSWYVFRPTFSSHASFVPSCDQAGRRAFFVPPTRASPQIR